AAPALAVVRAIAETNDTEILLSFTLALDTNTVDNTVVTVTQRGTATQLSVISAVVTNGTNILLVTDPRIGGNNYDVALVSPGPASICPVSHLTGNFQLLQPAKILPLNSHWRYLDDTNNADPGGTWFTTAFDDSTW